MNVRDFWNTRYDNNWRGSGAGSRGRLAQFKADVINEFISLKNIRSVVDLGCGDGEIAGLIDVRTYTGIDVSKQAITLCKEKFENKPRMHFNMLWDGVPQAELALSLDVIYHLLDDDAYVDHMHTLFESAQRFVCIYSCNFNGEEHSHIRPRNFSADIAQGWQFMLHVPNLYPDESWSEFYFYEKLTRSNSV